MKSKSLISLLIFVVVFGTGMVVLYKISGFSNILFNEIIAGLAFLLALIISSQARVILGDSEKQVVEKFGEAALTYTNNPVALHLRAMNMLYEGLKQNSTIVIVPSSAVDTMQLISMADLTALTMGIGKEKVNKENGDALQRNGTVLKSEL